ncbi:hypothetical protein [Terribacillus sp. AE2B 122]|uniref:hypothetical protein n=1 Tax=Terribacillus sp. AE2B 122 TaxID=1331902 RepID=UPI0015832D54|nr:hypothetical protein [Terribacillus sp. AE2B 122]
MSAMIVVPLFFIAVYLLISFFRSKESKSAKGAMVQYKAMSYSAVVFPIGWVIIEVYRRLIQPVPLETYRDFMTMLLPIIIIVYGFSIFLLKRSLNES